jgi:hypothetical protein
MRSEELRRAKIRMYENMCAVLPAGASGTARLEHFEVSPFQSSISFLRRGEGVCPGTYVRLVVNGAIVMSNTQMEERTNLDAVLEARGDVLLGGLGIGLIVLPMLQKPTVDHVTVIERNADVIALVSPHLQRAAGWRWRKVTIIHDDIFTWTPTRRQAFDTIYFDIWSDIICEDNLTEINALHKRFRRWKKRGGWMSSWQVGELRRQRRATGDDGW